MSNPSSQHSKEWFVYLGQGYRGPYSERLIQTTLEHGALPAKGLAWKQGMEDWRPFTEIDAFKAASEAAARYDQLEVDDPALNGTLDFLDSESDTLIEAEFDDEIEAAALEEAAKRALKTQGALGSLSAAPPAAAPSWAAVPEWNWPAVEEKTSSRTGLAVFAGTVVAILGLAVYFTLLNFEVRAYPILKDISADEYIDLKNAASQNYERVGTSVAIAAVPGSIIEPRFYVGTNLPDGSKLEFDVLGIAETLVDAFNAHARVSVKVERGFARTQGVRLENGQRLPRGEYHVFVRHKGEIVAKRTLFLGGPKDRDYEAKLKLYHERLKVTAQSELDEIRQFTETLAKQLRDTNTQFKSGRDWSAFHKNWVGLQNQIDGLFAQWTPEALTRDFYYGSLYLSLKQVGERISKLHADQNSAMALRSVAGEREQILAADALSVESALLGVRAKIALAERQPLTPGGLPQRQGL